MPKLSASSKRWVTEHENDYYVQQAKAMGYRSRAAFKLLEIQEKDKILKPNMRVVDLGAAPGSWSQIASNFLQNKGQIIASDILPMEPLSGVTFVQGDFTEEACFEAILATIDNQSVDLVMSDLAPNMSGIRAVDQLRAMHLAELALEFAEKVLDKGDFLVKVFQGEGFEAYLKALRQKFNSVKVRKPKASRARSQENYLLARGYRKI